jgi:hypothetical protein
VAGEHCGGAVLCLVYIVYILNASIGNNVASTHAFVLFTKRPRLFLYVSRSISDFSTTSRIYRDSSYLWNTLMVCVSFPFSVRADLLGLPSLQIMAVKLFFIVAALLR